MQFDYCNLTCLSGFTFFAFHRVNDIVVPRVTGKGQIYKGEWLDIWLRDQKHGHGVLTLPEYSLSDSTLDDGVMNGDIVFSWPDNSRLEATFKNGIMVGYGLLTATSGDTYTSQFINFRPHGHCEHFYIGKWITIQELWINGLRKRDLTKDECILSGFIL